MAHVSEAKWECEYCTYKNFDAAKKCTICQAPRPPKFITEPRQTPDIYQVASLTTSREDAEICIQKQNSDSNKWTCERCTYLNWDRSKRCIICQASRHHESEGGLAVALAPLTINTNTADEAFGSCSQSEFSNSTYANSPAEITNNKYSPGTSKTPESNNKTVVNAIMKSYQKKWVCKVCTYENWPKATKCCICFTSRSPSISPSLSPGASQTSPPTSPRGAAASMPTNKSAKKTDNTQHTLQKLHDKFSELDWLWLKACVGTVEGDRIAVDAYLACGGDVARQLTTEESKIIGDGNKFQKGHTLLHLALQSQREDVVALLLTASVTSKTKKRLPPHTCPDLANEILRTVACSLRQRKGDFPCFFFTESVTFALPGDIVDLLPTVEKQLLSDILDQDVQRELEIEESIINWSPELCDTFGSRLFALWNRSAGDCLLDSVLQATWGVFDKDNTLRLALSDSLTEGAQTFYSRWKEFESRQALMYEFTLDEDQWGQDWNYILSLARQPGSALEQTHIFALAHILRRPIIVYGVKYVKSFRGETIDLAKFQGVYLPLLWEQSFCWKSPITLGYTRGHFSALVPMETDLDKNAGAGAMLDITDEKMFYLPLIDKDGSPLPLHFLTQTQIKRERAILMEWLNCREVAGIFCAEQSLGRPPPLVKQMTEEWMDRYRHLSQAMAAAGMGRKRKNRRGTRISSEEEMDDE